MIDENEQKPHRSAFNFPIYGGIVGSVIGGLLLGMWGIIVDEIYGSMVGMILSFYE